MKSFHFLQKVPSGFTLIELMIVISIIGILASIAYPSFQGYMERAHDVRVNTLMRDWIAFTKQYRTDNGGSLTSQSDQIGNIEEAYCISSPVSTSCTIGAANSHLNLSSRFNSTPEGKILLEKRKTLPWYGVFFSDEGDMLQEYKISPARLFSNYGGKVFPGIDPTSTTKIELTWWYLEGDSRSNMLPGTNMFISGSNMPLAANKRCAPGFASDVGNIGGVGGYTECTYIY